MASHTKASKFLALVLRHNPEAIGLHLDKAGYAVISELIELARKAGVPLSLALVQQVVATSDKQRFSISDDGTRIRANQGHSIPVDLGLQDKIPPEHLYHGTAARNVTAILREGIKRGGRNFVHLSLDQATAMQVGRRYGKPVAKALDAYLRDFFDFAHLEAQPVNVEQIDGMLKEVSDEDLKKIARIVKVFVG